MRNTFSMKNTGKRIITAALVFALIAMLLPAVSSAATSRKCHTISSGNTPVYRNSGLTARYGTIYGSDELRVLDVTRTYSRVTYPISGGRTKNGYVRTSAILWGIGGNTYASSAQITTYKRPGGASYGYVSRGDRVMILGSKNGYTQIKYPVKGGYKYAFVSTANANRYIMKSSNSSSVSNTRLSYGLYKNSSVRISCGFDGYTTTSGRHEGIDFVCYNGAPVYSLTAGTVVRVAYGSNDSRGLSTIAIYDRAANKTVVYLHANPVSLRAGQSIAKGQKIATQGWRGVSSSSGSHTHVEVRNGKQGYAAKSVEDPVLNNAKDCVCYMPRISKCKICPSVRADL